MHLNQMIYVRPDMEAIKGEIQQLFESFKNAETAKTQIKVIEQFNEIQCHFVTMFIVSGIDKLDIENQYEESMACWKLYPIMEDLKCQLAEHILTSPFKAALTESYGQHFMDLMALKIKPHSDKALALAQQENELSEQYWNLRDNAEFEIEGATHTIMGMNKFITSPDRNLRKKAVDLTWSFYEKKYDIFSNVATQLIQARHQRAVTTRFKNYIQLGYLESMRVGVTLSGMQNFHRLVKTYFVPLLTQVNELKKQNLGLEKLTYYDSTLFKEGNPKPVCNGEQTIEQARFMYEQLSPETGRVFNDMLNNGLLDYESRKGKSQMNSCGVLPKYGKAYVKVHLTGTMMDVSLLCHEFGHAFQNYLSAPWTAKWKELGSAPTHICEIHSTAMELLTWDYHHLFFEEATSKYQFRMLVGMLAIVCNNSMNDEFQHFMYQHPHASAEELATTYKQLKEVYRPDIDESENGFLQAGKDWLNIVNVVYAPFYAIGYALAAIASLQLWQKNRIQPQAAWQDYLTLCRAGGSQPFHTLLKMANLDSPFDENCMKAVAEMVEKQLATFEF